MITPRSAKSGIQAGDTSMTSIRARLGDVLRDRLRVEVWRTAPRPPLIFTPVSFSQSGPGEVLRSRAPGAPTRRSCVSVMPAVLLGGLDGRRRSGRRRRARRRLDRRLGLLAAMKNGPAAAAAARSLAESKRKSLRPSGPAEDRRIEARLDPREFRHSRCPHDSFLMACRMTGYDHVACRRLVNGQSPAPVSRRRPRPLGVEEAESHPARRRSRRFVLRAVVSARNRPTNAVRRMLPLVVELVEERPRRRLRRSRATLGDRGGGFHLEMHDDLRAQQLPELNESWKPPTRRRVAGASAASSRCSGLTPTISEPSRSPKPPERRPGLAGRRPRGAALPTMTPRPPHGCRPCPRRSSSRDCR